METTDSLRAARGDGAQRLARITSTGTARSSATPRSRRSCSAAARARCTTRTIRSSPRWARGIRARCRSRCERRSTRGYSIVEQRRRALARARRRAAACAARSSRCAARTTKRTRSPRSRITVELDVDLGALARRAAHVPGLAAPLSARRASAAASRYIDDSKGTNVGATLAALNGFAGPLVLIAGGLTARARTSPRSRPARRGKRARRGADRRGGARDRRALLGAARAPSRAPRAWTRRCDARGRARATRRHRAAVARVREPDMFRDYKHRGDAFAQRRAGAARHERRARRAARTLAFDPRARLRGASLLARSALVMVGSASIAIADSADASRRAARAISDRGISARSRIGGVAGARRVPRADGALATPATGSCSSPRSPCSSSC